VKAVLEPGTLDSKSASVAGKLNNLEEPSRVWAAVGPSVLGGLASVMPSLRTLVH
jgi:hypothetical protein